MSDPKRRAVFELTAAAATGVAFYIMNEVLNMKLWFIVIACAFWLTYFMYCLRAGATRQLAEWGMLPVMPGARAAWAYSTVVAVTSIVAMLIWDSVGNRALLASSTTAAASTITTTTNNKTFAGWTFGPTLLLYPLWGTVQQFLVLSLGARNVYILLVSRGSDHHKKTDDAKAPDVDTDDNSRQAQEKSRAFLLTSIGVGTLFGALHIGAAREEPALLLATWILGLVWVPLYLRYRCVLPLGVYHGVIGAFFYFAVLRKDPLAELLR